MVLIFANSLLVKGTVSQVDFIEKLVATLDIPKRHIELSLWIIDIDKTDLEQLGADWSGTIKIGSSLSASFNNSGSISTLDGTQFIATIQALAQKRRAAVVARPVVLTQENIPAIFDNNRTFYTKLVGERTAELDEVTYGTMISVLPRFASQSAVSSQIAQLEAELGAPLFDRVGKTVRLTGAGETFLGYARTLLATVAMWMM